MHRLSCHDMAMLWYFVPVCQSPEKLAAMDCAHRDLCRTWETSSPKVLAQEDSIPEAAHYNAWVSEFQIHDASVST